MRFESYRFETRGRQVNNDRTEREEKEHLGRSSKWEEEQLESVLEETTRERRRGLGASRNL